MTKKILDNFLKQLEIIFEDERRFSSYFQKNYPTIKKILPNLKLIIMISLFFTINYDYQNYIENAKLIYSGLKTEEAEFSNVKLSLILLYFYIFLLIFDYFISMFVIFNANHPDNPNNNVDQDNDNEPNEQAANPVERPMRAQRANTAPTQSARQPQEERVIRRVNSDPTPRRPNR